MGTLKLLVTVFQDEEGWYVAECPAIPGCVSQGRTSYLTLCAVGMG